MSQLDEQALKNWLARERKSIEVAIDFWDNDNDFDMVSYEYARLDEIQRVESIISELK